MSNKPDSAGNKGDLGKHLFNRTEYTAPDKLNLPSQETPKHSEELEKFKEAIIKHFPFTVALALLPHTSYPFFEEDEGFTKEEIEKKHTHLMLIIPEEEYKNIQTKIKPDVLKIIKDHKLNYWVHIKTPVDVWNYGLDSKFEYLDAIGGSVPLFDSGFLGLIRVAVIHKNLILRKFDKYVASYVIGGSLVTGTATKDSDVDTFVIIDDTDVKRMPRLELLEKLRAYIHDFIKQANAYAGVNNPLNVQVYLLTDFWDNVKDANPIIFTFIRDGIPMYDRGTFLPWKLLLQMGKIKPSPEAVDKFMKYGEQNEALVKRRMTDAMIDIYYGILTPTQALMMLAGHAPPTPKAIVKEVKSIFVDKEKIMSEKELKILEKAVHLWKQYEYGKLTSITGKEIDQFLEESKHYDTKLKEMRKKLEKKLIGYEADKLTEDTFGVLKNIFGSKNQEALIKDFEKNLVKQGIVHKRLLDSLKELKDLKDKVKAGKISQTEFDIIKRGANELFRQISDYVQRKELSESSKSILAVKGEKGKGELIFSSKGTFFVVEGRINKIHDGKIVKSSANDLQEALAKKISNYKLDSKTLKAIEKEIGEFTLESN